MVPHLSHYIDQIQRFDYETWMRWCLAILRRCDAILYLASSPGADRELACAQEWGLIVFRSLEEVPATNNGSPRHCATRRGIFLCADVAVARCDAHGWMCREHWDAHDCRCKRQEVLTHGPNN